jgi:hypothetical protein
MNRVGLAVGLGSLLGVAGCSSTDVVFGAETIELDSTPVRVGETAGQTGIPVRLARPAQHEVTASYETRGIEAQDGCQKPDFVASTGTLVWPAGSTEAIVNLGVTDDDLAETDERLAIALAAVSGVAAFSPGEVTVVIEDDDRTGLVDAEVEYGVAPGLATDQSAAIQQAFDAAARLGRGVVVVAPGDYEVESTQLAPGTTLSARGAHWHRPAGSPPTTVTLRVAYAGASNSVPTLVEGLTVDGRRDSQGAYQNMEQQDAHLVSLGSAVDQPGRLQGTVDDVTVTFGTGDGVAVGPNSDVTLCRIRGTDLWREFVSLHGGGSTLDMRDLAATASVGTSGMWLDGDIVGYQQTRTVQIDMQDVRLGMGDIEIELRDGSRLQAVRLQMDAPPFRVLAPGSTVRIADSVIQLGIPSDRHNHFDVPHDVQFTNSTIISSKIADETGTTPDTDVTFGAVTVHWQPDAASPAVPGPHEVLFSGCRFQLAGNFKSTDTIYGVEEATGEGKVVVQGSTLGSGYAAWFAPACADCQLGP